MTGCSPPPAFLDPLTYHHDFDLRTCGLADLRLITRRRSDESLEQAPMLQNGEHEPQTHEQIASEVQDNCDTLQHKLTAFESAWHIVRLACSRLSSDLALARSFSIVRHVDSRKIICIPSCLRLPFYRLLTCFVHMDVPLLLRRVPAGC